MKYSPSPFVPQNKNANFFLSRSSTVPLLGGLPLNTFCRSFIWVVRSFYNLNPKKDGNEDQIIQKCLCMTGSKLIDIKWNKMYEAAKFKLKVTPNNTARKRLLRRGELFMYSFVYFFS